jgi:hypothetical protein
MSRRQFSAEEQLVLLLARPAVSPEGLAQAVTLLAGQIDWPRVLSLTADNGVDPLVCANLMRLGFPDVPEAVREELKHRYAQGALVNHLIARESVRLLRLLDDAGIRAIPLKGVSLAEWLYENIDLRPSWDIDVLIRPIDVEAAVEALTRDGYRTRHRTRLVARLQRRRGMHVALDRRDGRFEFPVEVHWNVRYGQRQSGEIEDLWNEAHRTELLGARCWAMSPAWIVLFLATHAARHRWYGLKWIIDVHEVCARGSVDWDRVRDKADQFGLAPEMEITLSLCDSLYGLPAPPQFPHRELPSWIDPLAPPPPHHSWHYITSELGLLPGARQRAGLLLERLLTPTTADEEFFPLPESAGGLYFVIRPLRLVVNAGREMGVAAWQRLRGRV